MAFETFSAFSWFMFPVNSLYLKSLGKSKIINDKADPTKNDPILVWNAPLNFGIAVKTAPIGRDR